MNERQRIIEVINKQEMVGITSREAAQEIGRILAVSSFETAAIQDMLDEGEGPEETADMLMDEYWDDGDFLDGDDEEEEDDLDLDQDLDPADD